MGGYNPRKVEQVERAILEIEDFAKNLERQGNPLASKQLQNALMLIQSELEKLSPPDKGTR